mgnify:CR=1 FL=1
MNYRENRIELLDWTKKQLMGDKLTDNILIENNPFDRYFTGILFPISEPQEELDENSNEEDTEEVKAELKTIRYQPPSSLGFSFYMKGGEQSLRVFFQAYTYTYNGKENYIQSWKKESLCSDDGEEIIFNNKNGATQRQEIFDGKGRIDVIWRQHDKGQIATVTLTNAQQNDSPNDRKETAKKSLFEVVLKCFIDHKIVFNYPSVNKALLSDEEKEIELRYKDEHVYAVGHGVAVDWQLNTQVGGYLEIYSDFMPTVEVPQVTVDISEHLSKALSFDFLKNIEDDQSVLDELNSFVNKYEEWIIQQQKLSAKESDDEKDTAGRIIKQMLITKQRMKKGLNLLSEDLCAKRSFSIMNQAMLIQMRGSLCDPANLETSTYNWRPFQLAFILSVLESTINEDSDFRDVVDLIWFPTGGGKTEAYLGLMAFLFAYRRQKYSASSGGTIAIMRYTLRLLTTQQFMRACKVISALELIRQTNITTLGKDAFTVGLWLGSASSPNTFQQAQEKVASKQFSKLILTCCPWCQQQFTVKNYICSENSFHFSCLNTGCDFGRKPNNVLPYNVVDDALYSTPPTLLIATVDKFARLCWENRATAFFGQNANRPPELIIQDELHLISGALGSIVGMYEVGIESILLYKGIRTKYIASTATIKNAKDQIKSLFARDMSVFPPIGLRHTDSYFAKTVPLTEKPGRLYIGYLAFGLARVKAIEPLAGALLAAPTALFKNNELLLDAWWSHVIYHGSLKGVGSSRTNYGGGVLTYLNKINEINFLTDLEEEKPGLGRSIKKNRNSKINKKYPDGIKGSASLESIHDQYYPVRYLNIKSLSSNQSAQENAEIFGNLNLPREDSNSIDIVLATNMISVGLDVSRLALMIINGQPLTTAEYIQASSRVGRSETPGLVFVNYYKTQARSLSHYENFKSYHSTFYRYVEPSSLTPFTFQVRQRALHAALVIAIRHTGIGLLNNKGAEKFDPNNPQVKKVIKILKNRIGHACQSKDTANKAYEHIDYLIDEWASEIKNCTNLRYDPKDKSADALLIPYEEGKAKQGLWKTLNSMRNVEKTGLLKLVKGVH